MFDLHLGDKLSIPSTLLEKPLFLTGRTGQGKSTAFLVIVYALIRNSQSGLIFDPYGDLVGELKKQMAAKKITNSVVFGGFEMSMAELKKHFLK